MENLKDSIRYNIKSETGTSTISNLDFLKSILDKWFRIIDGNIDLSLQEIDSLEILNEYTDRYFINWLLNLSNNKLTSFNGFPASTNYLELKWNKIRSMYGFPIINKGFKIDNNYYNIEQILKWSIYKYWTDYFIIQNIYSKKDRSEILKHFNLLMRLDKEISNYLVSSNSKVFEKLLKFEVSDYSLSLKKIYQYKLNKIGHNINYNWKMYLKEILNPDFHKSWGDIKTLEIKDLKWDFIEINWKKFNKKLSKTLK